MMVLAVGYVIGKQRPKQEQPTKKAGSFFMPARKVITKVKQAIDRRTDEPQEDKDEDYIKDVNHFYK
jgi:hypothetical protein